MTESRLESAAQKRSLVILTRAFSVLFGVKTRMELFKEIIVIKVDLALRCNYPLKNFGDKW